MSKLLKLLLIMKWIPQLLLLIALCFACKKEDSGPRYPNPVSAHLFVGGKHMINIDTTYCVIKYGPWLQKTTYREVFRYTSGPKYHNRNPFWKDYSVLHFLNLPICLLYTSPSPRDRTRSRMPSSA